MIEVAEGRMHSARLFGALLFVAATLHAEETASVWQTDWNTAFTIARQQHRLVFVDYFAKWCQPCRTMEATVFSKPDVQQRLADFVLLRVDVDRLPLVQRAHLALPMYTLCDTEGRERFRMVGSMSVDLFSGVIDSLRRAGPSFIRAAELLDSNNELQADFLLGSTYARIGLPEDARKVYEQARKLAEKSSDKVTAQVAQVQSAFTFVVENNPSRAIKLLKKLAQEPVNRENEAVIWVALGHAYERAKDPKAALDAYQHAQSFAARESRTYQDASEAIARLQ
jgi:thiol-disulfide isomerase/thioredoxin